jgi:hypothetical protein
MMATLSNTDRAAGEQIVDCRRCAKVNVGDVWLAERDAIREPRTYEEPDLPRFSSTVCPHCLAYLGVRPGAGGGVRPAEHGPSSR